MKCPNMFASLSLVMYITSYKPDFEFCKDLNQQKKSCKEERNHSIIEQRTNLFARDQHCHQRQTMSVSPTVFVAMSVVAASQILVYQRRQVHDSTHRHLRSLTTIDCKEIYIQNHPGDKENLPIIHIFYSIFVYDCLSKIGSSILMNCYQ